MGDRDDLAGAVDGHPVIIDAGHLVREVETVNERAPVGPEEGASVVLDQLRSGYDDFSI